MKFLILNDLHLEHHPYQAPLSHHPDDGASFYDAVILAGDIHTKDRGVDWALNSFPSNLPVFYVPGNHEGYGTHWEKNIEKMKEKAKNSNVHVLNNNQIIWNGCRFLGSTAWVSFSAWPNRQEAMFEAGKGRDPYQSGMRDYRHIRTQAYRRIQPSDVVKWNYESETWLKSRLAEPFSGSTFVITHHAPSPQSLSHPVNHPLDASYVNTWDDWIKQHDIAAWFHGHTHHMVEYLIGNTPIFSHPRGYPGEELHHSPYRIWNTDNRCSEVLSSPILTPSTTAPLNKKDSPVKKM